MSSTLWVRIQDKYPEPGQPVLITDGECFSVATRYFIGNDFKQSPCYKWDLLGVDGYEWDWYFDNKEPTHWMPLPEFTEKGV